METGSYHSPQDKQEVAMQNNLFKSIDPLEIYHELSIYQLLHYEQELYAMELINKGMSEDDSIRISKQLASMVSMWQASQGGIIWAAIMQGR